MQFNDFLLIKMLVMVTNMFVKCVICVIVLLSLQNASAQIAVYQLQLGDLYKMQTGIGWPNALHLVEGHEALLKLDSSLENQELCEVTTPAGESFNVAQPVSNRYESWTEDGCGLRMRNVTRSDEGRWRLTASRGNNTITGWTEVYVQENINQYTGSPIVLHDGETHATIDLTTLENSYCLVAQPFSDRTLVPGHCSVTLDKTSRAVQGNWHVLLGLPGRVSELPVDRSVTVESERLDTGFVHRGNKLHIYCNLHHTEKNITFCRFQRTSAQSGFNVMDGLSDGAHSYYGEGFAQRQCGMTVETPVAADFGSWRCTVGVQERVGTSIEQKSPMQALIRVTGSPTSRSNMQKAIPDRTIFVQRDMTITITCEAEASLSYCWFQHPNGSQFTPVPLVDEDQHFWYSGESLSVGDCGITFTHVTENDGGVWTCHMGPRDEMGVEITDKVTVRVTGPLAAREKEVSALVGGNTTLYCHSSNGNRALDYCRFLSPTYLGISVDETVTKENAVLERFFFTPERELNYGDCSLTIDPVMEEDVGIWTCAALVDDETMESRDTIYLMIEASQPRSVASIVGMSVGLSSLFLIFGGVMLYKYGNLKFPATIPWRRTNNTDASVSFDSRSSFGTRSSGTSTALDNRPTLDIRSPVEIPMENKARVERYSINSGNSNSSEEIQTTGNIIDILN